MPLADLATPGAKIHAALEDLQLVWSDLEEVWNDANRRKFEEEQLLPLALTIRLSLDAVGRMDEVLHEAERVGEDGARESIY